MSERTGAGHADPTERPDSDEATDEATDDADAGGDASTATVPRRTSSRPTSWWVGWGLAAVGLVAAAVLGALLQQQGGTEEARAEVEEAAGRFALALTDWDASDGMGETREELRAASTETFGAEVDELFGGTDDLAELEEIGARSQAEVDEVLVESVTDGEAEVLAVVTQRVTTDITEGEEVSLRYARMGMVREDGAWRVRRVELLVDLLQETAERVPGENVPGELDLDDAPGAPAPGDAEAESGGTGTETDDPQAEPDDPEDAG